MKNNEETWGTFHITVNKIGRKWVHVTIPRSNGYKLEATVDKSSIADCKIDDEMDISGCLQREFNGYGTKAILVVMSKEKVEQAKQEADQEAKRKEEQRWWGYFQNRYEQGGYYSRAVEELHKLGCHEHDEEIKRVKKEVEEQRWWGYFQNRYEQGGYYSRAVEELHKLGCHEHDDEIERCRMEIEEQRVADIENRRQTEKESGIVELRLPAYFGFSGKPEKGSYLMEDGVPYMVLSSYYHNSDGFSFGVLNEQWYSVKAKNISDTETGKKMINEMINDENNKKLRRAYEKACQDLEYAVRRNGSIYTYEGDKSVDDIPGETILDTFNAYGGGIIIRYTEDTVWLIINNGGDGDAWGTNNLRTGGAGAYAFRTSLESVKDILQTFLERKKACH